MGEEDGLLGVIRDEDPPNSEDELNEGECDDSFSVFFEGCRFVDLTLQVGMKFTTKQEFMEAVREFAIQEGMQIKFKRNESYRVRTVCKWQFEDEPIQGCNSCTASRMQSFWKFVLTPGFKPPRKN
ncbi:hypothetical protein PIB30_086176 [Stylosanthes scabra]|uniref:Transposase MuDR plant domain-containing protein n=1 Tax=Stylosanthes scabra TaxID=79078 RepID=A0ABU6YS86_9FABA|nr:hypothetical protein [Stylosanthes scabra]